MLLKLVFFVFFFHSFLFSSEIIEIKISKLHGLVSFVHALADLPYSVKAYKKIYLEKENTEELERLTFVLAKVYKAKIYAYQQDKSLYHAIQRESAFINSIDALEERFSHYKVSLSQEILQEYFLFLRKFSILYEDLIYRDSIKKLEDVKVKLQKIMLDKNYDALIYQVAYFYGLPKSEIRTIYLSLYPIPHGDNTLAFMLGDVESIGVLVHKKKLNLEWLLSATIFHEIVHTFYQQNYDEIKKLLYANQFIKYADQKVFNESLATAFGAGWAFYKLTALQSNGRWYNNPIYNQTAKKIYPLLSFYMDNNKRIDNAFVQNMQKIYQEVRR